MKRKKILLLHGWNWKNYTHCSPGQTNPWNNRLDLLHQLENTGFEVVVVRFPGFCGEQEPKGAWHLSDYQKFVQQHVEKEKPDAVLGYSFGGAVALGWRDAYQRDMPLVLISPAIIRKYSVPNTRLARLAHFFPEMIRETARDWYLRLYVKNPFHRYGSAFLRKSYRNIVGVDVTETLLRTVHTPLLLVYGSLDTATPVSLLLERLPTNSPLRDKIVVIEGGGHDIANSHTSDLVEAIHSFLNQ